MRKLRTTLRKWRGWWRLLWGFCPACNSDAPRIYDCSVCQWNHIRTIFPPSLRTKQRWWDRFINYLAKEIELMLLQTEGVWKLTLIIIPDKKLGGMTGTFKELPHLVAEGNNLPEVIAGLSECVRVMQKVESEEDQKRKKI